MIRKIHFRQLAPPQPGAVARGGDGWRGGDPVFELTCLSEKTGAHSAVLRLVRCEEREGSGAADEGSENKDFY